MQSVAPLRSSFNGADAAAGGSRSRGEPLWARALEVVTSTERSRGQEVDEERRAAALVAALTENPKAAKKMVQAFANRAILGLDVQLLRGGQGTPITLPRAQLRLTPQFDYVLLTIGEREKGLMMKEITRVSAGLPQGVTEVEHARCATLEIESGDGVVILFINEDERNECVLCLLMLTDAAHGRSLSLSAGKGLNRSSFQSIISHEGEGDDSAGPKTSGSTSPMGECPARDRTSAPSVKSAAALVKSKAAFAGALSASKENSSSRSPRGSVSPRNTGGGSPRNVGSPRSRPTVAFEPDASKGDGDPPDNSKSSPKVKSSLASAAAALTSPKGKKQSPLASVVASMSGAASSRSTGSAGPKVPAEGSASPKGSASPRGSSRRTSNGRGASAIGSTTSSVFVAPGAAIN